MDCEFHHLSARACVVAASAAVLASAGIVWSVIALAGHYDDEFLQVAKAQSAAGTQHALAPGQAAGQGVNGKHARHADPASHVDPARHG